MSIDAKNAFNTVSRTTMLSSLYEHKSLAPLFTLADWAYATPSHLFYRIKHELKSDGGLVSKCGGRQGCTLAGLLFCLSILPDILTVQRVQDVEAICIVDDVYLIAPSVEKAISAYRHLRALLRRRGIELNAQKSALFNFVEALLPISDDSRDNLSFMEIPIVTKCASVLGTYIGTDHDEILHQAMRDVEARHNSVFEAVHHVPKQEGILLI